MRIRVDASDARSASRKILAARFALPGTVRSSQRQIADGAVTIFRRYEPRKTGGLNRGTRVVGGGATLIVRADAKSPEGFNYVPVTRKGRGPVRPRNAKALKIPVGGGFIFRMSAKAWRPASDWALDAHPEITRLADAETSSLSRRIGALFR